MSNSALAFKKPKVKQRSKNRQSLSTVCTEEDPQMIAAQWAGPRFAITETITKRKDWHSDWLVKEKVNSSWTKDRHRRRKMLFLLEVFVFLCIFGYFVGRNRWVEQPSVLSDNRKSRQSEFLKRSRLILAFHSLECKNLKEKSIKWCNQLDQATLQIFFLSSQLICWLIVMRSYQAN